MVEARHGDILNGFLVGVFNEILKTEELSVSGFDPKLSLREIHVIEAVCNATEDGDNSAASVADSLMITAGTLTTAVALLEKKGYLERRKDERDGRVVRIFPTERGLLANAEHARFHREMIDDLLAVLTDAEAEVLVRALGSISAFFRARNSRNRL